MGTSELLPCLFCGSDQVMMFAPTCRPETPYNPADRLFPIVRCIRCRAEVAGKNEDYSGRTAIDAWNRRASPDASLMREILEAMEAAQSALAMIIAPDAIKKTTVANAFAVATAAESKARAAIARAEGRS